MTPRQVGAGGGGPGPLIRAAGDAVQHQAEGERGGGGGDRQQQQDRLGRAVAQVAGDQAGDEGEAARG